MRSNLMFNFKNLYLGRACRQAGKPVSNKVSPNQKGFFLAELIVAVFIFSIVMTISIGSLLITLDANKKTQSLKSVLNNLNIVLDAMTKSLAVGKFYHCGSLAGTLDGSNTRDCENGNSLMSFLSNEDLDGDGQINDVVTYVYDGSDHSIGRTIKDNGPGSAGSPIRMTAPEVNIENVQFYVTGTTGGNSDNEQPKVLISIKGTVIAGARNIPTEFMVQTVVSQRIPDF